MKPRAVLSGAPLALAGFSGCLDRLRPVQYSIDSPVKNVVFGRIERFPGRIDGLGTEDGAVAELDRSTSSITMFGVLIAGTRECHRTFLDTINHDDPILFVEIQDKQIASGSCPAEGVVFRYRLRVTYEAAEALPDRVSLKYRKDSDTVFETTIELGR